MAKLYHEFDQEELAAIFRMLKSDKSWQPIGGRYSPEVWSIAELHSQIRAEIVGHYGVSTRTGRHSALRRYR